MTRPLSPSAQAVLDAADEAIREWPPIWENAIAAALRAAADQVVPDIGYEASVLDEPVTAELQNVRERFLAIVAELEGTNG